MAVAERFIPGRAGLTFGAKLARRPDRVVKRAGGLSSELVRVAAGRGSAEASTNSPAWRRVTSMG